MTKKKIIITGAGGGFGSLITNALIEAGHTVVASMREVSGRNKEKAASLKAAGAAYPSREPVQIHIVSMNLVF